MCHKQWALMEYTNNGTTSLDGVESISSIQPGYKAKWEWGYMLHVLPRMQLRFAEHNVLRLGVPYSRKIWRGIKFGGLADRPAYRQIKIRQYKVILDISGCGLWVVATVLGNLCLCGKWMTCHCIDSLRKLACQCEYHHENSNVLLWLHNEYSLLRGEIGRKQQISS